MNTAKRDIANQYPVELRLREFLALSKNGIMVPKRDGKDSHKDCTIYVPVKYEIKNDYMAEKTGNIYLEIFNPYRQQPSGLGATTADRWIHVLQFQCRAFEFLPKRMITFLIEHPEMKLPGVNGDRNSEGYVVPIATVERLPFVKVLEIPMI
jgi:hypothetical protein